MSTVMIESALEGLTPFRRGKVRDLYELGDDLLIVVTDRISAFDYVLGSGIPDKGKVLNQLSAFWFNLMTDIVPNHVITTDPLRFPEPARRHAGALRGRSMLVRRTRPLPIECVVRGYLSGSGLKEYQKTGAVCGISLPKGLLESSRLPAPIFTPSTKADSGHDINITEPETIAMIGRERFEQVPRSVAAGLQPRRAARRGMRHPDRGYEVRIRHDRRPRRPRTPDPD